MATTPRIALVLLLLAAASALPACGNKGSLVMPPAAAMDAEEVPPADALPPPTEPTEADPPAEIEPPPAADPPSDPSTEPVSGGGDG